MFHAPKGYLPPMSDPNHILGIDVGATGIKGAIVDVSTGKLLTERLRVPTPQPATPKAMTKAFHELYRLFEYEGDVVGVGFPAIIRRGVALSAANISPDWIRTSVSDIFGKACGKRVFVLNDADAAGLASATFGSAQHASGVTVFLTIGTGIGSALFIDNELVPNSEFGHIYMPNGMKSEHYASSKTRKSLELGWEEWGRRFGDVLSQLERILSPDLFVLGGGASKHFDLYKHTFETSVPVVPAEYQNEAGAVGAALFAHKQQHLSPSRAVII